MFNVELLLELGWVHGDLSAYNILYRDGRIVLIDEAQTASGSLGRTVLSRMAHLTGVRAKGGRRTAVAAHVVCLGALASASARAEAGSPAGGLRPQGDAGAHATPTPAPAGSTPAIDLGVGSVFPLYLGAQGTVEGPYRLLAGIELGWMPEAYAFAIDDVLQTVGAYPTEVSQLIREALQSSVVIRPSLGWRPFPRLGLETSVGYTYLSLGGGLGARQVIETVTGRALPNDSANQIPLHSSLHNVHAQVAWRFVFGEHWVVRPSIGFLHCVASSSGIDVEARTAPRRRAVSQVNSAIDDYLNGYYTRYVNAPLLGVTAAYRL